MKHFWTPLMCVCVCLGAASASAHPSVQVRPDGATVLKLNTAPGEDGRVAMALVVDVGAAQDPDDKHGLAMMTAHGALVGSATADLPLDAALKSLGASIAVEVGMFSTAFVVTAPKEKMADVLPLVAAQISNPFWHGLDVDDVRQKVTAIEQDLPAGTRESQLDQLLFPSVNRGRTPAGTEATRASVSIEDIQEFFATHYQSAAMTWLLATDLPVAEEVRLIEGAIAFPPVPTERRRQEKAPANVPSEAALTGPKPAGTIVQKVPSSMSTSTCRGLALALEVAARPKKSKKTAPETDVTARCRRWRGEHLLIFRMEAEENGSSDIVSRMGRVLKTVAGKPVARDRSRTYRDEARKRRAGGRRSPLAAIRFARSALDGDGRSVDTIWTEWSQAVTPAKKLRRSSRTLLKRGQRATVDVTMSMKTNRSRNR